MSHTPGPWWTDAKYNGREMGCAIIAARTDAGPLPGNPTRGMVAWASAVLNTEARICEANARLIAAAPDLLNALRPFADMADQVEAWKLKTVPKFTGSFDANDLTRAKAAVSKAEGR